jgi:membrane protease YdiL (CAAX protease family)
MGKEATILGVVAIIVAIFLYLKTKSISFPIILGILGVTLIIFNKEEDRIEQRKDIKTKKR